MKHLIKIIAASNTNAIEREAQELINQGWVPMGPATAVFNSGGGSPFMFTMTLIAEMPEPTN